LQIRQPRFESGRGLSSLTDSYLVAIPFRPGQPLLIAVILWQNPRKYWYQRRKAGSLSSSRPEASGSLSLLEIGSGGKAGQPLCPLALASACNDSGLFDSGVPGQGLEGLEADPSFVEGRSRRAGCRNRRLPQPCFRKPDSHSPVRRLRPLALFFHTRIERGQVGRWVAPTTRRLR
jgi:hypothetical protein